MEDIASETKEPVVVALDVSMVTTVADYVDPNKSRIHRGLVAILRMIMWSLTSNLS